MKFLLGMLASVIIALVAIFIVVNTGVINIGADQAHSKLVYTILETARSRSIENASRDIVVPNLDKVEMISSGGADYKDMCAGCHLSPDAAQTDLSAGLYPKPPNFTDAKVVAHYQTQAGARQGFWAIKHGIMASGMPAWGATHDDDRMWAMMAFIRSLPELNANQYTMLTTRFDDEMMDMSFDNDVDGEMNSEMMDMSDDEMQH